MKVLKGLSEVSFVVWWDSDVPEQERFDQIEAWIEEAKTACGGDGAVRYSRFLNTDRPGIEVRVWTPERFEETQQRNLTTLEQEGRGDSQEAEMIRTLLGAMKKMRRRDTVTIKQLAIESGQNENTVRGRINKARKLGKLKKWEKQGGTVLVDRTEGLKIARSVGQPMVKMGRPKKSH